MGKNPAPQRDLRLDVFIGDGPNFYRVTHPPTSVEAESHSIKEAEQAVEMSLAGKS